MAKKTILSNLWHVIPQGDIRSHRLSVNCWCSPQANEADEDLIVHTSMDRREYYDAGERNHH